jgi:hypothetical protein
VPEECIWIRRSPQLQTGRAARRRQLPEVISYHSITRACARHASAKGPSIIWFDLLTLGRARRDGCCLSEVTNDTFAVKVVLIVLAGIVTDAGTVAAESLLTRLIASPPGSAAVVKLTGHASDPAPVIEAAGFSPAVRRASPL